MSFAAAEADRRIANAIQIGTVIQVGGSRAAVQIGDIKTPMLAVGQLRAGAISFYWAPQVGEQVLIGCPSGDIAQGVIIAGIFAGNAPSSNPAVPVIELQGGTMEVRGTIIVTGGDVIADGISLKTHTHPHGDPAGQTGVPS